MWKRNKKKLEEEEKQKGRGSKGRRTARRCVAGEANGKKNEGNF